MTKPLLFSKGTLAPAPAKVEQAPPDPVPLAAAIEFQDWEVGWLPPAIRDWVHAQAAAHAVPRVMPLAAAMCAMATLLQGKVEVEVKPGWREPLSLFWVIASPTGAMKSSVLTAAKAPIKAMESALGTEAQDQAKSNRKLRYLYEGRCKKLRGKFAAKGSLSEDDRNDLNSLEAQLENLPNDKAPVWLYSNINPALLPKKLQHNHEAEGIARLAVLADEDTFLRNMMGRHSGQPDLEAVLSGYTGGAIEMTRKSVATDDAVDVRLDRVHLTMLVMTQPHVLSWLREQTILADQGFWGRTVVTNVPRGELPAADAPTVPEAIQTAYARCLATLATIPAGTTVRLPSDVWEAQGPIAKLYADVRAHTASGQGAEGYAVRTVGRVARFWAIAELAWQFEQSQPSHGNRGRGGDARMGKGICISYLPLPLYYQALRQAQDLQPATPLLDGAPLRVLSWLRRFEGATVGKKLSRKLIMNANHLRKDTVADACDTLVEHGYLKAGESHRNRNGTQTFTYIVTSLYAPDEAQVPATVVPIRTRPNAAPDWAAPPTDADPPAMGDYTTDEEFE